MRLTTTASALALAAAAAGASAKLKYLGVALSGIDFGCDIDGTCPLKTVALPLKNYGGADGKAQMEHFVKDDNLNMFRLPVSWQFLTAAKGGSVLDPQGWESYDLLMQTCLDTGAHCMIDLHNFGRFDGGIIGQGGPSDATFAQLWANVAARYADNARVVFGLMNEPHDLDITKWAGTCQAAVTAIRKAGAKEHMILLPGNNFTSVADFVDNGSAELLSNVTNPDGSTAGLLLDLHKYLDSNNSGQNAECTTDNAAAFTAAAAWLRARNRTAMVSESGASMRPSCMQRFCAQNRVIADNADVFAGFVGWSAGSFDSTYVMTLTPTGSPGAYVDNKLMQQCILDVFKDTYSPDPIVPPPKKTSSSIFRETSSSPSASASGEGKPNGAPPASGVAGSTRALALVAAVAVLMSAF